MRKRDLILGIIHVASVYEGGARHVLNLYPRIIKKTDVIFLTTNSELKKRLNEERVTSHFFWWRLKSDSTMNFIFQLVTFPIFFILLIVKIKILESKYGKIKFFHLLSLNEQLLFSLISRILKIRCIWTVQAPFYCRRNFILKWLFKAVNKVPEKIIAVSSSIKDLLVSNCVDSAKIYVVKNGIEVNGLFLADHSFRKKHNIPVGRIIAMVSRVDGLKGHEVALNAFKKISEEFPDTLLVIAGDGPKLPIYKKLAATLGFSKKVFWLGNIENVKDLFSESEMFILPSKMEGLPLTVLEAMSARVPVIASNVGGIPEILKDGKNGILIPPDDVNALILAMRKILAKKVSIDKMTKNGFMTVKRYFSVDSVTERTLSLFYK